MHATKVDLEKQPVSFIRAHWKVISPVVMFLLAVGGGLQKYQNHEQRLAWVEGTKPEATAALADRSAVDLAALSKREAEDVAAIRVELHQVAADVAAESRESSATREDVRLLMAHFGLDSAKNPP